MCISVQCTHSACQKQWYAYAYVCTYIYMCIFFAVSVACTLEQLFWALVHVQTYTLYRCLLDINVHVCETLAAGCAHMCMCIYID